MTSVTSSFTDQLGAWGQVAGAVATFLAVVVALVIATSESRRAKSDRTEEARRRAAMVVPELQQLQVDITNFGESPIWGPTIVRYDIEGAAGVFWKATNEGVLKQVLEPKDTANQRGTFMHRAGQRIIAVAELPPEAELIITFEFVDHEGRRWRRTGEAPPVLVSAGTVARPSRRIQVGRLAVEWNRR